MRAQHRTNPSTHVRVVDKHVPDRPRREDLVKLSERLPHVLSAELDYAVSATGFGVEEFLLAALGRAVARTVGSGVVTVNGLTAVQPFQLCCATSREIAATNLLKRVRAALDAGQGPRVSADLVFTHLDAPPDPTFGPIQASDGAALALLTYRDGDVLKVDWWYDSRRLFAGTIEELSRQFNLGMVGLTSEATAIRSCVPNGKSTASSGPEEQRGSVAGKASSSSSRASSSKSR
jgi:hypothetical protein